MKSRKSVRAQRARQVLIGAIALFLVTQFTAALSLDYVWPLLRFQSAREVIGRMVERESGPDVIFLGSSRMAGAIVEPQVEQDLARACRLSHRLTTLNAAVPAGDPAAQERVLDEALKRGARPRLVVIEVAPEFFSQYGFCAGMNGVRLYRLHELHAHVGVIASQSYLGRLAQARFVPLYQHREQFWALAAGRLDGPITVSRPAFGPPPPITAPPVPDKGPPTEPSITADQLKEFAESAWMIRTKWLGDYHITPGNSQAVRRMIARCRESGIEPWLMTTPVSSPHRAIYDETIEAKYQQVLAAFDCRHIDSRDWIADAYFRDCHHLRFEGGEVFSRLITQRLLAPYWKQALQVSR